MARWRCPRCKGLGQKPFCIVCMKTVAPTKITVRKSQDERVADMERRKVQDIKEFREKTQVRDLKRMLRNMKKVGMVTTGIPALDAKLRELDPTTVVDDLDAIRLNLLKMGSTSCGVPNLDKQLVARFGPPDKWLESFKDLLFLNMIEKTGLAWLDLKLIEVYGPRESWKLI